MAVPVLVLALAGCGSASPVDGVPALARQLDRVDDAAVAEDPEALTRAVDTLLATVEQAEQAGDLAADDAERIRGAAAALLEVAEPSDPSEDSEPAPPQESTEPPETDPPPPPAGDEGDDGGPPPGRGKPPREDDEDDDD